MASILDTAVSVAEEASWGVPVKPVRSFEAFGDDWVRQVRRVKAGGFVRSQQAALASSDRPVTIGAQGSITVPVLDEGMQLLFKHAVGDYGSGSSLGVFNKNAAPRSLGGSPELFESDFRSNFDGPTGSYTVDVYRVLTDGSGHVFRHRGCVATGWSFDCAVNAPALFGATYDAAGVDLAPHTVAPPYASQDASFFGWDSPRIFSGGRALGTATSIRMECRHGMRTGTDPTISATKTRPRREQQAVYLGALEGVPADLRDYLQYESPDLFEVRSSFWPRPASRAPQRPFFQVWFRNCRYLDSRLRAHLGRLTSLSLPFQAFWVPPTPAAQIEYRGFTAGW